MHNAAIGTRAGAYTLLTVDCHVCTCIHIKTLVQNMTPTHTHTQIYTHAHTHTHTHTQQVSIVPADIAEAEEEYGDEEEEVRMILLPHGCVAPNFSCSCFANTENKGVTSMAW